MAPIFITQPLAPLKGNVFRVIWQINGEQYAIEVVIDENKVKEIQQITEKMQLSMGKEKV